MRSTQNSRNKLAGLHNPGNVNVSAIPMCHGVESHVREEKMERIPYDKDELRVVCDYPPTRFSQLPRKKYQTPITPKANYLAVFRKEMPLWIPLDSDSTGMFPGVNPDNHARGQVIEAVSVPPDKIADFHDAFGVEWVYDFEVGGSMVKPGKPMLSDVNEWESVIEFPDIDRWDWNAGKDENKRHVANEDRIVFLNISNGLFERLISFMDFQYAALAIIDEDQKDAVHSLFSELCGYYERIIKKYKEHYSPDVICFHDDWGSQRAPFFSLNTVREMLVPYIRRISDTIHSHGMFFQFHSCGKNEILMPAYIESGADAWTGQKMNDKDMLYDKYGDLIILGVDPDIPMNIDMNDEDAIAAAKRLVAKYAPDFEKKPVIVDAFQAPNSFIETIYEESRIFFC